MMRMLDKEEGLVGLTPGCDVQDRGLCSRSSAAADGAIYGQEKVHQRTCRCVQLRTSCSYAAFVPVSQLP